MTSETYMWKWVDGKYLIETINPKVAEKIRKWSFSHNGPAYGVNHYRRQFLIPAKKRRLACKLLDIPYQKKPGRVKAGRQAANDHPVRRG